MDIVFKRRNLIDTSTDDGEKRKEAFIASVK